MWNKTAVKPHPAFVAICLCGVLVCTTPNRASANEQILHSFVYSNGVTPRCILAQAPDGTLYGTTVGGGTSGDGVVFQLGPDGTAYKVLHNFTGGTNDGYYAHDGLVLGNDYGLYGVTAGGGISNAGCLYRLDLDGANYRILHHFGVTPGDGSYPAGRLLLGTDGAFYGTTGLGGTSNLGTVFRISASGTDYQLLHMFGTEMPPASNTVNSLVHDNSGTLYGTTASGGTYGAGTIFSLKSDGTQFRLLHSFPAVGNYLPSGLLMGEDGNIYGVFVSGATGVGAVFRMSPDGTGFAVIKILDKPTLGTRTTLSQASDGTLFGTSSGYEEGPPGFAFRLNTDGTGFSIIRIFVDSLGSTTDPEGALLPGIDGALYGTTGLGGALTGGTVFRLTSPPLPFLLSITTVPSSGFHVSTEGIIGSTYYFQTSTDLLNWSTVGGAVSNETGLVEFFDWNKVPTSQRFYRMVQTPP